MAFAAVASLLQTVSLVLNEQLALIRGAESELKLLQEELQDMKAFLEESAGNEVAFGKNFRKMIDLAYEVEDVIDAYVTQVAHQKWNHFGCINLKSKPLRKAIRALREGRLCPLIDEFRKSLAAASAQDQRGAPIPLVRQDKEEVVGFEDEADILIKNLLEESEEALHVIPIYGMGGMGKTTLARMVYDDHLVQSKFTSRIWVCVSQNHNINDVLLSILNKFTQEDMSGLSTPLLAEMVRSNLESRRYLLVLDDVWTAATWRHIDLSLPKINRFGKVIVTTRNAQVAREANDKRDPHCMRFLTDKESWELLCLKIFGRDGECPSNLEEVGKRITMTCGGLPLAVKVAGEILHKNLMSSTSPMKDEWEKVSAGLSTYLENDYGKCMERIIALSYNKLPSELRICFLYLGLFPEDFKIPTRKLIQFWIAEGFILPILGKSLEEVAEDYIKDLIDRNLVMVDKTKAGGGIKTLRISSMIREFCTSQASLEHQNLFQEVYRSGDGAFCPPIPEVQKCRRLCIHSNVMDFIPLEKPKGHVVRSFVCFAKEAIVLQPEYVAAITEAFDGLRVLDANPIKLSKFPPKIAHLIHLRYIALSGDNFKALPAAFYKLWNLQTIRIETMSRTFEIKAHIWKIISLRHLKTNAAIVMDREAKCKGGENLQTLSRLSTQSFSEDFCKRVVNLKKLGIRGYLDTLLNTRKMAGMDRLEKLKLFHDVFPNKPSAKPLIGLPHPEAFPPNLRILKLSSTYLEWKHMDTLGMLPTLEILELKANAFMGRSWEVNDELFCSLEVLSIESTNLEVWTASEDPFRRLKCLVLKDCAKLEEIPCVLAKKGLQVLDIERVSRSAVESARRIEMKKLQMQDKQRAKRGGFELRIAH